MSIDEFERLRLVRHGHSKDQEREWFLIDDGAVEVETLSLGL